MTIQEVLSIKEERSRQTKNMTVSELKDYYAKRMREFSIVMGELVFVKPRESLEHGPMANMARHGEWLAAIAAFFT